MFELVYNSIASTTLKEEDLLTIQKISGSNNSIGDITGCLFTVEISSWEFLEGSVESVKVLYSKIERNTKHTNISTLAQGPIKERQFDNWNMISAKGPKNGTANPEDALLVRNVLGLVELTEKRTYGSRVFWHMVKRIIRETALQQANQNNEGNL